MLKNHKQTMHDGKLFECHKCDYQVAFYSGLAVHKNAKHMNKKFDCSQCDYQTPRNNYLMMHIKAKHSSGMQYVSDMCDYQSKTERYCFQKHIYQSSSDTHWGETRFVSTVWQIIYRECDVANPLAHWCTSSRRPPHHPSPAPIAGAGNSLWHVWPNVYFTL